MESTASKPLPQHPAEAVVLHYERLTGLLTRRAGSSDAAREVLHETWLRLKDATALPAANASAYAYATARNLLVDQHRRRQSVLALETAAAREATPPFDATLHAAAHRQALAAIKTALATLPERTRDIFLQHRLLDVPHADLARHYGVSRATVERDIARGAVAMQTALQSWQSEPSPATPRSARRRGIGALLGMAGLLSSGLAWRMWQQHVALWQMAWQTQRGQQLTASLPDGSRVTLDAQTRLEATYYGDRRQLALGSGGVYFDVARDTGRPFRIDCGSIRVTVLGTRFSIDREGQRVRIDVDSGLVRVNSERAGPGQEAMRIELGPGEGLVIDAQADHAVQVRRTPALAAPWRAGRLSFDGAPLADIVERLSRYHPRSVAVDPRLAALPVTAEIRIALVDEWLRHVLPRALPVVVTDTSDGLRIMPRR